MKLFWWFALVGIGVVAMADDEYDDYYYDDDYDRDSGKFIKQFRKKKRKRKNPPKNSGKLMKKNSLDKYLLAPKKFQNNFD